MRRRVQNLKRKEAYLNAAKEVKKAIAAGKAADAKALLAHLYQALDKAAKTNAIAKNKARRLKSRLTKLIAHSSAK